MRIFLLAIIISLSGLNLHSQTNVYHPFPGLALAPDWRADWDINNLPCTGIMASCQFFYTGDTTIGSYTYHKVNKQGYIFNSLCYYDRPFGYQGAIREDTLARRIYMVVADSTHESLMYDFSLSVGDTVYSVLDTLWFGLGPYWVDNIDSVLVGNSYRKRLNLMGASSMGSSLIEGIGGTYGLVSNLGYFEAGSHLICYLDTAVTYITGSYSPYGCGSVVTANTSPETEPVLSLYPNPAENYLQVSEVKPGTVFQIYNAMGQSVLTIPAEKSGLRIDLSGLEDGLYILQSDFSGRQMNYSFVKISSR